MPPRNPAQSVLSEEGLARRIARERERRGWTYEGLARRMTVAGCPINQSAIYKIEKGTRDREGRPGPARRITVQELLAFSKVFEIDIDALLLPPEVAESQELSELLIAWDEARLAADEARGREFEAWDRLVSYAGKRPELHNKLEEFMRTWATHRFGKGPKQETQLATHMWRVTRSEDWARRLNEALNEATQRIPDEVTEQSSRG